MSTEQQCNLNLAGIKAAIRDYELVTGVNCYLLNKAGKGVGDRTCYQCSATCSFVKRFDPGKGCVHDYPGSCRPALDEGKIHFYDCPYGLLNVAISFLSYDETVYYASSGPLLLEPPDKIFIRRFMEANEQISSQYHEVERLLQGVPLVDSHYLQALGNTLQKSVAPYISNHARVFRQKQDTLALLMKALEREAEQSSDFVYSKQVNVMAGTIESIFSSYSGNETLLKKALHEMMSIFVNAIYQFGAFEKCKHRAALFFLALMQIGKKRDLNLEFIFGKGYESVFRLLEADAYMELNQAVFVAADRFQCAFFLGNSYRINEAVLQAMEYIQKNYMDLTLTDVAKEVSLHPNYLSDLFKKQTGQSYSEYVNKVRVGVSKQYMREDMPLAQIAQQVGFADQSYFVKVFKHHEGISPSKWRTLTCR